jgi:hypothetical protein
MTNLAYKEGGTIEHSSFDSGVATYGKGDGQVPRNFPVNRLTARRTLLSRESSIDNLKLFRPIVRMGSDATRNHVRFEPADLPLLVLGFIEGEHFREDECIPVGFTTVLGRPDQAPLVVKHPAGWA